MFKDLFIRWDRIAPQPYSSSGQTAEAEAEQSSEGPLRLLWHRGFIANRAELIRQCDLPGDTSDPRLLLLIYQGDPDALARRVAGPCSYVIWDDGRRRLTAVRDRSGSSEIFYRDVGGVLYLSNRVEWVLTSLGSIPKPNLRSVAAHLFIRNSLPGESFYESISTVPAGGHLIVTQSKVTTGNYWSLKLPPQLRLRSDMEYAEAYRELLFNTAREYAAAGSAGITLSSGLDSTSVAAALNSLAPECRLRAFTWVAPELPDADEEAPASTVCRFLGLDMEKIRADRNWPLSRPAGIETSRESPFLGFYTELWEATLRAMQERGISVLFTGSSGDHLFGGDVFAYPDLLLTGQWGELVRQLRIQVPHSRMNLFGILRNMVVSPILKAYVPKLELVREARVRIPWLSDQVHELHRDLLPGTLNASFRALPGRRQRFALLQHLLQHQGLGYHHQHFASFNIERRNLLMDHRLIEFAASLPTTQTFQAAVRKTIVRRAMRGYLPADVLDMRRKIYPDSLAERGLKYEKNKVWPLMTKMRAAELGLVDEGKLRKEYGAYLEGGHRRPTFWFTITLEDWLRRHF